jgi:hypothetical protein
MNRLALSALLITSLILCGCASKEKRFLTPEEDAEMGAKCSEGGCTCMPNQDFEDLMKYLQKNKQQSISWRLQSL